MEVDISLAISHLLSNVMSFPVQCGWLSVTSVQALGLNDLSNKDGTRSVHLEMATATALGLPSACLLLSCRFVYWC